MMACVTRYNLVSDFGAVADGVTNTAQAFFDFRVAARQVSTKVELLIPPGVYHFANNIPGWNGLPFDGVRHLVVNARGATIDKQFRITTSAGFPGWSSVLSARVDTVPAGATSAKCKVAAHASRFPVGMYVALTALDWQGQSGQPPNHQYVQFVKVLTTDAVTGIVEFAPAAKEEYSDQYRDNHFGGIPDCGGPACLFLMDGNPFDGAKLAWDQDITINGLTLDNRAYPFEQTTTNGRKVVLRNMTFRNCVPVPSTVQDLLIHRCVIDSNIEIDKECERVEFRDCDLQGIQVQSSSVQDLIFRNCSIGFFTGTARRTQLDHCSMGRLTVGVKGFGCSESLVVRDCIVTSVGDNLADTRKPIADFVNDCGDLTCVSSTDFGLMTWGAPWALLFQGGNFVPNAGHPTTISSVGRDGSNRAVLHTDFADPFVGAPPNVGHINIVQHACRDVSVFNSAGCLAIADLSAAPKNIPLWSYAKRSGHFITAGENGAVLWGKLVRLRVNVIRPYTGVDPTQVFLIYHPRCIAENGSDLFLRIEINTRIAGERKIDFRGVTGAKPGDVIPNLGEMWFTHSAVYRTSPRPFEPQPRPLEAEPLLPIIEFEILTDQEAK